MDILIHTRLVTKMEAISVLTQMWQYLLSFQKKHIFDKEHGNTSQTLMITTNREQGDHGPLKALDVVTGVQEEYTYPAVVKPLLLSCKWSRLLDVECKLE